MIHLCFPSVCVAFSRFSSFLPKTKNMQVRLVGWVVWRFLMVPWYPPHQHLVWFRWWLKETEWRNRLVPVWLNTFQMLKGLVDFAVIADLRKKKKKLHLLIFLNLSRTKKRKKKTKKPNSSTWVICWIMSLQGWSIPALPKV